MEIHMEDLMQAEMEAESNYHFSSLIISSQPHPTLMVEEWIVAVLQQQQEEEDMDLMELMLELVVGLLEDMIYQTV